MFIYTHIHKLVICCCCVCNVTPTITHVCMYVCVADQAASTLRALSLSLNQKYNPTSTTF